MTPLIRTQDGICALTTTSTARGVVNAAGRQRIQGVVWIFPHDDPSSLRLRHLLCLLRTITGGGGEIASQLHYGRLGLLGIIAEQFERRSGTRVFNQIVWTTTNHRGGSVQDRQTQGLQYFGSRFNLEDQLCPVMRETWTTWIRILNSHSSNFTTEVDSTCVREEQIKK